MAVFKNVVAAFLVALFIVGCTANPQRVANQIVVGMSLEPLGFYPLRALDSGSYYAQTLVYEGLVRYGPDLNVVPAVARSFSVSADGLTYTFELRPDVKFSDGTALTFADVDASFKLATSDLSPFKADYQCISTVEHKGDAVVLHLSKISAPLLSRLVELRILPSRIISAADHGKAALNRTPLGSGPFRLLRWESGLELVFAPNPYYWGNKPTMSQVVWRIVPDKTLMAMALKRGELDVAALDAPSWKVIKGGAPGDDRKVVLDRFPGSRTVYVGFNTKRHPFDNVFVRQAIGLAINRQDIANALYAGFAVVPRTDVFSGSWVYNPNAKMWPFDLQEAREKLSKAGYKFIGRNWKSAEEKLLAFRILTIRDYEDVAQIICDDLKALDVPSEVQVVEYATLRQRYMQKGEFDAIVWSRSSGPDPECSLVWGSKGVMNYAKFTNPRVDALLEEGKEAADKSVRIKAYQEIQGILANELPWVFLIQPDLLVAHWSNIGNIKQAHQNLTGLPWDNPLFNAAEWKRLSTTKSIP